MMSSKFVCPPNRLDPDECQLNGPWVNRRNLPVVAPDRFSHDEWRFGTSMLHDASEAERQVAEHLQAESFRVTEETKERAENAQNDVDWYFRERLGEVNYWRDELDKLNAMLNKEIDAEQIYRTRLDGALSSMCELLRINKEILATRECRVGIDLVHDKPQEEVMAEVKIVDGVQQVLKRTMERVIEQLRLLRKMAFHLKGELRDKDAAYEIDRRAWNLSEHRSGVHEICDICLDDVDCCEPDDWELKTYQKHLSSEREVNASVQLRASVDGILRQVAEDIQTQICLTNRSFEKRLVEVIGAKAKLEEQHADITVKIREMEETICKLEKAFEEKKSMAGLAETRVVLRRRRPNSEMVKDALQRRLILELQELNDGMAQINMKILQAKNIIRSLQRNQLELEDAINVKLNTIAVDETKVMPLRKQIHVKEY